MFLLGVAFLLLTADLLDERVPPFHALVLALPAATLMHADAQAHGLISLEKSSC